VRNLLVGFLRVPFIACGALAIPSLVALATLGPGARAGAKPSQFPMELALVLLLGSATTGALMATLLYRQVVRRLDRRA
jgi:branched-subunit amino acid ABC-type transport system permease component